MRAWSGQGQLWNALAAVQDDQLDVEWSAEDVRRRAHRILFAKLEGHLSRWPRDLRTWTEALPAESQRERLLSSAPTSGTSWGDTRRSGWPPRFFAGHVRRRVADTLLVTTLRWTIEQVLDIRRDAISVEGSLGQIAREQMGAVEKLLDVEPVASAEPILPMRSDVAALMREGRPWTSLAPVCDALRSTSQASLYELCSELIMPSEDINLQGRLFHLGVLGEVLLHLHGSMVEVRSLRPLSGASTNGPSYRVEDHDGGHWDLWFEASGMWSWSGYGSLREPYKVAIEGLSGNPRALGADLLLVRPGDRALVLECKYSLDGNYVASGYSQAVTYAMELKDRLVDETTAVVVGPEGVVDHRSSTDTLVGNIGVTPPSSLGGVLSRFLDAA
ncbi:MAG: hypothetical protein M3P49_07525 [Actinomycetota bacterium]|nr:hypothetical protein [Actinomycetota bacterium]